MKRAAVWVGLAGLFLLSPGPALRAQGCGGASAMVSKSPVPTRVLEGLVDAVEAYVEEGRIVGAELLVWQHDRVLLDRGFGWRDRERREPMRPGTVFNIRSMTKTMVGLVAQMLVDEGRLSLDDRVADFLPGFEKDRSAGITIDQLLTHRAGLPLSIVNALDEYPSLEDLANSAGRRGPDFPPGSRFWYSDTGADVLGAVVEAIEGEPLHDVLRERLVEPLGLSGTFAAWATDDPRWARVAPLYARAGGEWIRAWGPEKGAFYPFSFGSQGMMSTPRDFAQVMDLLLHGGSCGDERLLTARAVASMEEPVSRMTFLGSDAPEPTNFSHMQARYGRFLEVRTPWPVTSGEPDVVIGHSGSDGTAIYAWPDRDLVIAYFTQSRGNATHLRLERAIDGLLLDPGEAVAAVTDEDVEDLLGRYEAGLGPFAGSELQVVVQDGQLALGLPGGVISELRPPGPDGWRQVVLSPSVSVAIDVGGAGARAMRWRDPSGERSLPRVASTSAAAQEVAEGPADVAEYVGWYRLADDPSQPAIQFVRLGSDLAVVLPGAPAPLPFDGPDEDGFWALRANPAMRIVFSRDEAGDVVSYAAVGPDGRRSVRLRVAGG